MSASSKPEKGGAPTIRREWTIARGRRKHVLGFLKGGRQGSVRCETADTPCREWADTPCREWPDTPCREWAEGSRHPLSGRTCTFELREGLHTTTTPSQIVIFNINCAEHTCLEAISWRGKLGAATWTASSSFLACFQVLVVCEPQDIPAHKGSATFTATVQDSRSGASF